MKHSTKWTSVGLSALALTLFASSTQAHAVDKIYWANPSGSYSSHGRGAFSTKGDLLRAYDDAKDGESACVSIYGKMVSSNKYEYRTVCAAGKGNSKDKNLNLVEGTAMKIQGWMLDESSQYDHNFGPWVSGMA
ncbi:hypothetical protein GCM10009837_52580 [Streptomyces durmitorensis]|uniref:Secreted protein n=1 Tax=Streptomyces durmitorensis TaxID=319947 RepID=A0ABY4PU16_9ACTN|nr:hypothetical protein [Streptomyces durmitorensis]UQT57241.1 hypothetical protein M4V62_20235 [Streptomyces durmitorensis]